MLIRLIVLYITVFCFGHIWCAEIQVAVASNFSEPARAIAKCFEAGTGHKVIIIAGSTGKHYAQIINGAPYEVFLAADTVRPKLLEKAGLAIPGSRFTYAVGKLVLWSPEPEYVDAAGDVLERGQFRFLAIANPKLAPYGKAALEVLQFRGLWQKLQDRLVIGENIGQAFHFVRSGNAQLGFVAFAQLKQIGLESYGSVWDVPQELYTTIEQQAVLLKNSIAGQAFLDFLKQKSIKLLINRYGYDIR